jgi:hypothetical protein
MGEGSDDAERDGRPLDPNDVFEPPVDDAAQPLDVQADDSQIIAAARRRHGTLGGIVAAGMLGIDKVLGRKPREEIPVVVDAPTEPVDIDTDGITVPLDAHTDIVSPPLPRTAPKVAPTRRRRR